MAKVKIPHKTLFMDALMVALVLAALKFMLSHFGGPVAKFANYF